MLKTENTKLDNNGLQEVKYIPTKGSGKFESDCSGKKPDTFFLYFTILVGALPIIAGGSVIVYSSSAVVKLLSNDTNINPTGKPITTFQTSLFIGVPAFVGLIGSSTFPKLADQIGRKATYQIIALGLLISIIALAFSERIDLIITFGACWSCFYAGSYGLFPIYISEICEDHNRAKFGFLMATSATLGQLFSFILGSVFSFRTFTLLTALPLAPFLILFFWAPDSPIYLLSKGREIDCLNAIRKLRSNKNESEIDRDFSIISKIISTQQNKNKKSVLDLFRVKEARLGIFLTMLPITLQIFSGAPVVLSLLAPIIDETKTKLSGTTVAIIVGVVKVCCFSIASAIVEKFGRKRLLMISCIGAGLPVIILGLFFYLKHIQSSLIPHLQWVPLISILAYFIFYSFGIGPVPVSMMSELFLPDLKATATPILASYNVLLLAMFLFGFPIVSKIFGIYFCLWMFGSSCFLSAIAVYFLLPETSGKNILEIQEILRKL